jgi:hypothetical protein
MRRKFHSMNFTNFTIFSTVVRQLLTIWDSALQGYETIFTVFCMFHISLFLRNVNVPSAELQSMTLVQFWLYCFIREQLTWKMCLMFLGSWICLFQLFSQKCVKTKEYLSVHYAIMYARTKYTWLYLCPISQMRDAEVWYDDSLRFSHNVCVKN